MHVSKIIPQARSAEIDATTWAPDTSHNMGPEYVPQHGPRTRPTTWAPNTWCIDNACGPGESGRYWRVLAGTAGEFTRPADLVN